VNVTDCPTVEGFFDEIRAVAVLPSAWRILWSKVGEVLPTLYVLPPYTAVMLSAPAGRLEVVHVATPPLSGWAVHEPIGSTPSLNVTRPVGLAPVTVAVNVTDCPATDEFCEELTAVDVFTWTVCVIAGEVLPTLYVLPPYTAVMPSAPAGRLEVVHVATPPLSGWAVHVPIAFPPSSNATVPDGLAPVTVAVNVTDCPATDGFCEELTAVDVFTWTVCVKAAEVPPALFVSPP
jgi:hypothetical protein